ncbi:MAG: hypothetical protein SV862_00035 [Pseudomonadota bacterium]|nr:hypothetical protein [Pseudomonadota bacterium]
MKAIGIRIAVALALTILAWGTASGLRALGVEWTQGSAWSVVIIAMLAVAWIITRAIRVVLIMRENRRGGQPQW